MRILPLKDMTDSGDIDLGLRILGTGSALPKKVVTNDELATMVDTSDEWIRERTGIGARHIAENESVAELGAKAAKAALEMASLKASDIDLILMATCSSKVNIPCVACQVQALLEDCHAAAFDIGAACSGFLTALSVAEAYLCKGIFRKILVIGSEVLSSLVDWQDRSSCILFGDGAGAVVVDYSSRPFYVAMGADGSRGGALRCDRGGFITMDGQAVYRFAVRTVPKVIDEVLAKAGMQASDIDEYFLHQANKRIIEAIAKGLKQPLEKFPMNLENVGNTSSASIPILLDEYNRNTGIDNNEKLLLAGFGAGLTFGACVLWW